MLTPADAERMIRERVTPWPVEGCRLEEAHGRVLRAAVVADRAMPPFDRVTLDGYALRWNSLRTGKRRFRVEQSQAAGSPKCRLGRAGDVCIEVMTGAVVPEGADCIVPFEATEREADEMVLKDAREVFAQGNGIHREGSDHAAGEVLVGAGSWLTGREIAVAAACGYARLQVSRQPRIAVVATGDELVEVGRKVAAQQIRRSNDYALRAALVMAGYPLVERFHWRDDPREIAQGLRVVLAENEVAIVTGGVSRGKYDFVADELRRARVRQIFQGVAQRPGKPLWFGIGARKVPVFGLPGNPVSAYVCLHRYVLPALARASGRCEESEREQVMLAESVRRESSGLAEFVPVKLRQRAAGQTCAVPHPLNTSGDLGGLLGTDGFVELPAGRRQFRAGTAAAFYRW